MSAADRARTALVDDLVTSGQIRSAAVERAFRTVPRHLFLPGAPPATAYADDAIAVQHVGGIATSSASQPSMVAIMLEQLDLQPGHRVLEIGAGTGWNAGLMARIVGATGSVTSVDIDADLVTAAATHLAAAGVAGVRLVCGDGVLGDPAGAPYDRIVLTVGSDDVWPAWPAQLAPGGRLVLPLSVRGSQLSTALDLAPDGLLHSHSLRSCGFIRLRGIGAADDAPIAVPGGGALWVPPDGPGADPAAVAAALADPRGSLGSPVALAAADLWDGFGLWLALTEPGAARLLAGQDAELPAGLGPGPAVLALVTPPGARARGLATTAPPGSEVRVFGPGGPALGRRLRRALDAWVAAGAPGGPDWALTVVPAGTAVSGPPPAGVRIVRTPHTHLLLAPR